ncbi:MAG: hypothetical protein M3O30_09180 [Planctomycetota bacterium]|nr:hypothetical protein [Planctomycetota bacterium]
MRKCWRIFCFAALLAGGGCGIVGALAYQANGPGKVEARYVPPQDPMLVLVESWHNSGEVEADAANLSVALMRELKENKVAPVVGADQLERIRDSNPDAYGKMTTDAIGRAVGAKQVLYVDVRQSGVVIPPGSNTMRGEMTARVRIVDALTGETRWPLDSKNGELVNMKTDWTTSDKGTEASVRNEMADAMAEGIGKLFHSYTPKSEVQNGAQGEIQNK